MQADSLASAVSVLGQKAGVDLIEKTPGAAALTIWQPDDSKLPVLKQSKRFKDYLQREDASK